MRSARRAAVALVALLGLATVSVGVEYASHTDDGCGVEVHCLACRVSVGRTATATIAVALPVPGDLFEWLPVLQPTPHTPVVVSTADSRGPPA